MTWKTVWYLYLAFALITALACGIAFLKYGGVTNLVCVFINLGWSSFAVYMIKTTI